jgi:hypothetical protein
MALRLIMRIETAGFARHVPALHFGHVVRPPVSRLCMILEMIRCREKPTSCLYDSVRAMAALPLYKFWLDFNAPN